MDVLVSFYFGAAFYVAINCMIDGDMSIKDTIISSLAWPAIILAAR